VRPAFRVKAIRRIHGNECGKNVKLSSVRSARPGESRALECGGEEASNFRRKPTVRSSEISNSYGGGETQNTGAKKVRPATISRGVGVSSGEEEGN